MPADLVAKLLEEAENLTEEEQLELAIRLLERVHKSFSRTKQHQWQELRCIAPNLLGEDAQKWVSQGRLEGDQRWKRAWGVRNED